MTIATLAELEQQILGELETLGGAMHEVVQTCASLAGAEMMNLEHALDAEGRIRELTAELRADTGKLLHACSDLIAHELVPVEGAAQSCASAVSSELTQALPTWNQAFRDLVEAVHGLCAANRAQCENSVADHGRFETQLHSLESAIGEMLDNLSHKVGAFASEATVHRPAMLAHQDALSREVIDLRNVKWTQAHAEYQHALNISLERFMDGAEAVASQYLQGVQKSLSNVEHSISHDVSERVRNRVEHLKETAMNQVAQEFFNSIAETELSVALSSALSPVMTELVAFYKAVSLLEEAIRVYKEAKQLLSLGFL